jgi:hypothetical protein
MNGHEKRSTFEAVAAAQDAPVVEF